MGRLTERDIEGNPMLCIEGCSWIELLRKLAHYEDLEEQLMESAEIDIDSMVGEFMHYYNLQKENRLIELPCAVGDTVWTNFKMSGWYFREKDKPYPAKVVYIGINDSKEMGGGYFNVSFALGKMFHFRFSDVGKTVFLTKEEAEAKLKELEG